MHLFQNFDLSTVVISYLALLFSLCIHEASHAAAAYQLEDDTAYRLGRLTLNPLAHMDPIGTFLFPLLGMSTGLPFIGWAKPVPVNPTRFKRSWTMRSGMAWVSAAGPLSNLALSFSFLLILTVWLRIALGQVDDRLDLFYGSLNGPKALLRYGIDGPKGLLLAFAGRMVIVNIWLAIFNMIPFGPLDGAGVLQGFLPDRAAHWFDKHRTYLFFLVFLMVFTPLRNYTLGPVMYAVLYIVRIIGHLILGV